MFAYCLFNEKKKSFKIIFSFWVYETYTRYTDYVCYGMTYNGAQKS